MSRPGARDSRDSEALIAALEEPSPDRDLVFQCLQEEAWPVRRAAARAAAKLQDPVVTTRALIELAERSDPDVRASVAEALLQMGLSTIPALCESLLSGSHDMPTRRLIVEVLGATASPNSIEALEAALGDEDVNVRMSAAEALGRVGGQGAEKALLHRLGNEDFMVTSAVAQALWDLDAHVPLEVAVSILQDKRLVRPAIKLLGLTDDPGAAGLLAEALGDKARPRREAAVLSSARFLSRSDETLVHAFVTEAAKRRPSLCSSLGSALRNDSAQMRRSALDIAVVLAWPELLTSLLSQSIHSDSGELALKAVTAILRKQGLPGHIAPEQFEPEARALFYLAAAQQHRQPGRDTGFHRLMDQARHDLQSADRETALAAAAMVAEFGEPSDVRAILDLARQTREDVLGLDEVCASLGAMGRRYPEPVTELLAGLPDEDLLDILPTVAAQMRSPLLEDLTRRILDSRDKKTKMAGLQTLAHLPCSDGTEQILSDCLDDPDPDIRALAARALPANCSDHLVTRVSALLRDTEVRVRRAACFGLGRSNRLDSADVLEAVLDRGDEADVMAEAVNALIRIGARLDSRILIPLILHRDVDLAKAALDASRTGESQPIIARTAQKLLDNPRWDLRAEALRTIAYHAPRAECQELLYRTLNQEHDETVLEVARNLLAER